MNCSDFEEGLERVMAAELAPSDRAKILPALREHVLACRRCAGCSELLAWLDHAPAAVDRTQDPGEAYWRSFTSRLHDRIARDEADRARARVLALGGAAAAVLLAVVGLWRLGGGAPVAPEAPVAVAPPGQVGRVAGTGGTTETLPGSGPGVATGPAETAGTAPVEAGIEGPGDEADPLTTLYGEPPVELVETGDAEAEPTASESTPPLFPPTGDLQPEARRRFLAWIREREARLRGGSG